MWFKQWSWGPSAPLRSDSTGYIKYINTQINLHTILYRIQSIMYCHNTPYHQACKQGYDTGVVRQCKEGYRRGGSCFIKKDIYARAVYLHIS